MKYRIDFVTNSSSSSFVVAIRKDITQEILNDLLKPILIEEEICENDDEEYKKEAIKRVERYLKNTWKTINKKPTMDLGEWKLFCAINCYDGGDDYLVYLKLSEIEKSEYVKAIEVSD